MTQHLNLTLSGSIQACQQLTHLANSNFVPAFALLPEDKRLAMEIFYAYTRFTDDIVDLPDFTDSGTDIEISLRRRKQKLNQWAAALESVFGKIGDPNPPPQIDPKDEKTFRQIAEQFPNCGGVIFLPALKMIVDKHKIPRESLFHLIEGVESDMEPRRFETFDDCLDYCHQVASSVGFASLSIWGTSEPLFSEPVVQAAKACGVAFQWTNIVRDLLEDFRNGRIYLPLSELQRFGITENQFGALLDGAQWNAQKQPPKKGSEYDQFAFRDGIREMEKLEVQFRKLLAYQLDRCETYYANSLPLFDLINRDSRQAFGLMWGYYYALYRKILHNPLLVTREKRIRLSSFQKLRLWLRWRFWN